MKLFFWKNKYQTAIYNNNVSVKDSSSNRDLKGIIFKELNYGKLLKMIEEMLRLAVKYLNSSSNSWQPVTTFTYCYSYSN